MEGHGVGWSSPADLRTAVEGLLGKVTSAFEVAEVSKDRSEIALRARLLAC
jgi:hypothetical protein